jgi:hypothetical protein
VDRTAVAPELTAAERAELEGLAGRRRTVQGLAIRARIVLAAAEGTENKAIAAALVPMRTQSANGGGALPSIAWMGFMTRRAGVCRAGSRTRRSPRSSA